MTSSRIAIGNRDPAQEENNSLTMVKEETTIDSQDLNKPPKLVLDRLGLCKKIWVSNKRICIQARLVRERVPDIQDHLVANVYLQRLES